MSWIRFGARLIAREPAAAGQFIAEFEIAGEAPNAQPGQFVQLALPDAFWPRPFSLLDWRVEGGGARFKILFAVVGGGTRALERMAIGSHIEGHGPLGRGFPDPAGPTWMIAGGYGVAPLLFSARRSAALAGPPVRLFYGAASKDLLWQGSELGEQAAIFTTVDGSLGRKGTVLDAVRAELADTDVRPVLYSCGPMGLLDAVGSLAGETGLKALVSIETLMPCGMGVCRGCAVPLAAELASETRRYAMACEDGPVMDSRAVDWAMERACRL
jgi:dihydroorotate dehydrogenase electron transfer subunit